jgi:hypothetical protein
MRNRAVVCIILVVLIGLMSGFVDPAPQKVSLKYHPIVGDKTTYEVTTITEIETKGMPGLPVSGQKQKIAQEREYTETVKAQQPNGTYLIEMQLSQTTTQIGDTAPVSSSDLAGKVFTLEMSPEGKLLDIRGIDDLASGKKEETQKMIQQIREVFVFPQRDVAVGETWQRTAQSELALGTLGTVNQKIIYDNTLLDVEKLGIIPVAKISIKMNIEQKSGQEAQQMKVQGTGTGEGMILYDYQRSKVLSSNLTYTLNMSTTMSPPPGRTGPTISTQQNIVTKMSMKIKSPQ